MSVQLPRRALLVGAASSLLAGCDRLGQSPAVRRVLFSGEGIHRALQRAITAPGALAPEYTRAEMSPLFRVNGTADPGTDAYGAMVADQFANWRLQVGGLVSRPVALSLAQLKALPARTQITRHDCVEGWSAIGEWTGPMLGTLLHAAHPLPAARYAVFTCADLYRGSPYYESIDLIDAYHPQTILAWGMNGQPLSIGHGAPLRLRVERQLGYKQAKYLMRVDLVDSLERIGAGKGGYWEDAADYDWYAGI